MVTLEENLSFAVHVFNLVENSSFLSKSILESQQRFYDHRENFEPNEEDRKMTVCYAEQYAIITDVA